MHNSKNATASDTSRLRLLRSLGWSGRDAVGFAVALVAAILILANTLFLQAGPHPAPMVKSSVAAITPPPATPALASTGKGQPRGRADEPAIVAKADLPKGDLAKADGPKGHAYKGDQPKSDPSKAPGGGRVNAALIADIQRELSRRGYYDGAIDGRVGPRTEAAIREFEAAAGLRVAGEPNENVLRALQRAPLRPRAAVQRPPAPVPQNRQDPIAELITPSKQVVAVQKALSDFGYGQIRPTGIVDPDTQSAIQKFERERRLPVTGQLSHRVVRELASITGRTLE